MPAYEVSTPSGQKYRVTVPEGADPALVQQKLTAFKDHLASTSTTTTPTTRTFPQALGETAARTVQRPIEAGQDYLAQGMLPHSLGALGSLANTFLPFLAPEMTAGGAAAETMQRMQPGTTEPQAERAANVGQAAIGLLGPGGLVPAVPGIVRDVRAARSAANVAKSGASLEGVSQAGAAKVLTDELAKVGGPIDQPTFAKQARPYFRAMLRDARRTMRKGTLQQKEAVSPGLKDLQKLVGDTESWAPIAGAVAKDPVKLALLIRQGKPEMLPKLQGAFLTSALASATGRAGLGRDVIDIEKFLGHWDDLGQAGQTALFSNAAPKIRDAFEAMRVLVPSSIEGGKAVPVGSRMMDLINGTLKAAGVGGGVYEVLGGKVAKGIGMAGAPFILSKLLLKNGGAEWIKATATAAANAPGFARTAPALGNALVQILKQPETPPAPRMTPPMTFPPTTTTTLPPQQLAYDPSDLNTPEGIQRALNTRLPPGFRPGRSAFQ